MWTFFPVASTDTLPGSGSSKWRRSISSTTCRRARAKTSCNAFWARKPLAATRRNLRWRIRLTIAASSSDLLTPAGPQSGEGTTNLAHRWQLHCAQEQVVCSRTRRWPFFLRSSPSAILSLRFICILFSSDQSSKWFLLSFYFKIILSSINVLQSASSSAWLCEGAAWLLKRRRIFFFLLHLAWTKED